MFCLCWAKSLYRFKAELAPLVWLANAACSVFLTLLSRTHTGYAGWFAARGVLKVAFWNLILLPAHAWKNSSKSDSAYIAVNQANTALCFDTNHSTCSRLWPVSSQLDPALTNLVSNLWMYLMTPVTAWRSLLFVVLLLCEWSLSRSYSLASTHL